MMGFDWVLVLKTFSETVSASIWYFERNMRWNLVKLNERFSLEMEKDLACISKQGPLCKEEILVINLGRSAR